MWIKVLQLDHTDDRMNEETSSAKNFLELYTVLYLNMIKEIIYII